MTPPKADFFNQYVWHHRVHEHLKESVRYFLLELSPYKEDKLKESLSNLVKDHDISGLRAYRVFGQYDLLIRAWMHNDTYVRMVDLFYRYISIDPVRIERVEQDYITDVEYRWYEEGPAPSLGTRTTREELMNRLNYDLVSRIESGEDDRRFGKYVDEGLIQEKPSTENTITFFICVKFSDNSIKPDDRERLLKKIKDHVSERRETYRFAEIDRASGAICHLIIRARAKALDYFAIGRLTAWLSEQAHVGSTETYLSLFQLPLTGDTKLSLATFDARDAPNQKVLDIFPDPIHPNGPYPRRKWGTIADEVVVYLLEKDLADHPKGLKTFLHNFLLGVLHKSPAEMGAAIISFFRQLEGYLDSHKTEYIQRLDGGFNFEAIFEECFPTTDASKQRGPKLGLADLLTIYYKASKRAGRELKSPSNWGLLKDVRNWGAHGDDYKWEDAKLKWKEVIADPMIRFGHDLESLYREIRSVCKSRDEGLPDLFPDE